MAFSKESPHVHQTGMALGMASLIISWADKDPSVPKFCYPQSDGINSTSTSIETSKN